MPNGHPYKTAGYLVGTAIGRLSACERNHSREEIAMLLPWKWRRVLSTTEESDCEEAQRLLRETGISYQTRIVTAPTTDGIKTLLRLPGSWADSVLHYHIFVISADKKRAVTQLALHNMRN